MIGCIKCNGKSRVLETRQTVQSVRRRRKCERCGYCWSTFETTVDLTDMTAAFTDELRRAIRLAEQWVEAVRAFAAESRTAIKRVRKPKTLQSKRGLSPEQDETFRKLYPLIGTRALADRLGKSRRTIQYHARKLGLPPVDRDDLHKLEANWE